MLERHQEFKEQVSAALADLAKLAGDLGMQSLRNDIEGVRLPKLAEERFNLVVLGEFNHGKTTFVNALLGKTVLPIGVTPTTAAIHHLKWSDAQQAAAVDMGGERKELSLEELKHDKPAEYQRMVESGEIDNYMVDPMPRRVERGFRIFGFVMLAIGLTLIADRKSVV